MFARFADLLKLAPVLPRPAGAKFAPVHVGDVAEAFVRALTRPASIGQTYELYGPDADAGRSCVHGAAHGLRRAALALPSAGPDPAALMDLCWVLFSTDNFLSRR